jgi:hypothetical protein
MDMDFSPDLGNLSDRNNPPSDHPTPSTLNSSSNTSYSLLGTDDAPPTKKQQKSSSNYAHQGSDMSFDKLNSAHMPNSMGGQFYPSSSGSPAMPTESSNSFSMPSWDVPTQTPDMGSADLGGLNMEPLSESQWAQIMGTQILEEDGTSSGWENWRHHG